MQGPTVWTGRVVVALNTRAEESGPSGSIMSPGEGAAFDPGTGAWTDLPTAPPQAASAANLFWTGTQVIAWAVSADLQAPPGRP